MSESLFISISSAIMVLLSRILDRAGVVVELNFLAKGKKLFLFLAAFGETFIWCVFSSHVLKTGDIYQIGAYILGFAIGNAFGIVLLDHLSSDIVSVRIYIPKSQAFLMKVIGDNKYGATVLKVGGKYSDDNLMIIVNTTKKRLNKLLKIVKKNTPDAFVTVYDTKLRSTSSEFV